MLLTRLKELRELRGYSLRGLAVKSKVPYSAISLLENGKREPQGRTARKLAAALAAEVTDLYSQGPVVLEQKYTPALVIPPTPNDNKKITPAKPTRPTRARGKKLPMISYWVIEKDQGEADPFNVSSQAEAERLKDRLGGQHQARVYQAATRFEAWDLHRQFMIRIIRGYDAW